jgi:hypothetical protein
MTRGPYVGGSRAPLGEYPTQVQCSAHGGIAEGQACRDKTPPGAGGRTSDARVALLGEQRLCEYPGL